MERFENECGMCGLRSINNSTRKRVLNLLEPVKLTVWTVVIGLERVTVVKFRMNDGGGIGGAGLLAVMKSRYRTGGYSEVH